jgi:hypothetical protein
MKSEKRGGFEERLLDELRSLVVAQPSAGSDQPRRRAWVTSVPRPRLALVGGIAAVLAVAAAAGVPFLTNGASPAYAVNTNDDGTVTVEISSLSDAAGLEAKLRDAGIRAVVQYVPSGKACKQPWFTPAARDHGANHDSGIQGGVEHTADNHTRFTISRHHPTDATLVIMTQVGAGPGGQPGAGSAESVGVAWGEGDVTHCELIDAPAGSSPFGPPPKGAQLHTEGGTPGSGPSISEAGTDSK